MVRPLTPFTTAFLGDSNLYDLSHYVYISQIIQHNPIKLRTILITIKQQIPLWYYGLLNGNLYAVT